eukprot:TRINITY_DN8104_c0_g1_i1.p1 TRINITY_DN8104_c0_g1~~TRINITY_DN8104_c0_g1_i1.p1  ORF type:complete len:178 (-),score=30.41 TRINITY_DN8104_c0_g1_i1:92-625(-)
MDAFEHNIQYVHDHLAEMGVDLDVRPHAKTHKSPDIARYQIAAGSIVQCVAKVYEAEALAAGGITDILITNEIVGRDKLGRIADLVREGAAKISTTVDNAQNVVQLSEVMQERAPGLVIDVLIEVELGTRRAGVNPGTPVVPVAQAILDAPNLNLQDCMHIWIQSTCSIVGTTKVQC